MMLHTDYYKVAEYILYVFRNHRSDNLLSVFLGYLPILMLHN